MNYTHAYFRNLMDGLTNDQIRAIVDIAEGYDSAALNPWLLQSLRKRGFCFSRDQINDYIAHFLDTGVRPDYAYIYGLTELGAAFLAWYRAPRELPIQETLL